MSRDKAKPLEMQPVGRREPYCEMHTRQDGVIVVQITLPSHIDAQRLQASVDSLREEVKNLKRELSLVAVKPSEPEPVHYRVNEVARILRVSRDTVNRMMVNRQLGKVQQGKRIALIPAADVRRIERERMRQATKLNEG